MINNLYAEIFNSALESFYFNCENNRDRVSELKILNSIAVHLYGIAFCAEDIKSMGKLKLAIEQLHAGCIPRPFNLH